MDFDLDMQSLGIAILVWLFCVIAIWKLTVVSSEVYTWQIKLFVTILLLPITYLIVVYAANKD